MAERDEVGIIDGGGDCEHETVKRLLSKNLNRTTGYLTLKARLTFNILGKTFLKAPILQYFDLEYHIRIETNASGYAIGEVLSQLILDNLRQCHPVAYYSKKMIPAKTCYKIYNSEFPAILKAFKTWRHYLKGCKHEILILTDHNNL